ncbi:hypothetical protein [Leptospira sp. GIMC2001]|uniref:hypothetical protein n=1 Tax=Leptospira sp. GIMC2001 TaxID=1513297 RepID=UPI0023499AE7|nr:hypothetical protein [Leptospira sp. GIMC2001]WCL48868.1 hypothetical protein O4O04_16410 [Leptospira sp. GIMC2001]
MQTNLTIIGWILVCLSLIHLGFPKYFQWRDDLQNISQINREMMYVHTAFIGIVIFAMGILCIFFQSELIYSEFGNQISLGLGIFWFIRLLVQFFGYSKDLWYGKLFETSIHILFSILWLYISLSFIWIYKFANVP